MSVRQKIIHAMEAGDHRTALKLASSIPDADLRGWGPAIRRGREAQLRPRFQRQIGRDPVAVIQIAVTALEAFMRGETNDTAP